MSDFPADDGMRRWYLLAGPSGSTVVGGHGAPPDGYLTGGATPAAAARALADWLDAQPAATTTEPTVPDDADRVLGIAVLDPRPWMAHLPSFERFERGIYFAPDAPLCDAPITVRAAGAVRTTARMWGSEDDLIGVTTCILEPGHSAGSRERTHKGVRIERRDFGPSFTRVRWVARRELGQLVAR